MMQTSPKPIQNNIIFPRLLRALSGISLCLSFTISAAAQQQPQREGGERRGPPPEAFTVCASAAENDVCTVETPRGTLTGTCKTVPRHQKILCVPERKGNHERPPRDEGEGPKHGSGDEPPTERN